VLVAGRPSETDLAKLLEGVWLSDGHVKARKVKRLKSQGESTLLQIVLSEGKNREIRRMLARLGHKVMRLKRISLGPIKLDRLPSGKSRKLKREEVEELRDLAARVSKRPTSEKEASEKRPGKRPSEKRSPEKRPPRNRSSEKSRP
jgi:23S rRNA pseudouridine2605 synthase